MQTPTTHRTHTTTATANAPPRAAPSLAVGPQVHLGFVPGGLSHQADVGGERPRAAVGAAGHVDRNALVRQAQPGQLGFHFIEKSGQRPFRLGDRKAARRPGGAGD